MDSILMCEGRGASRPCSRLLPLAYLADYVLGYQWRGVRAMMGRRVCSRLGDAVLLAFLPDLYCLFLIYCWLWGLVSVGSVVLGRTGGPKGAVVGVPREARESWAWLVSAF